MISTISWYINIPAALLITCLLIYLYWVRNFNYWKLRNIEYEKPVPFFGNIKDVLTFKKNLAITLKEIYDKMDVPYKGIFIMDKPALLLKDVNLIRQILVTDFNNFSDRTLATRHDDLGSQLLPLMKNPDWRIYRKIVSPAYSSGRIKTMYQILVDTGLETVKHLAKITKKQDIVDARLEATMYGAQVITSTAFGLQGDCFDDDNSGFKRAAERIFDFNNKFRAMSVSCYMMFHSLVHLLKLKFVDAWSEDFLRTEFFKIVDYREANDITRADFVDILINLKKNEKSFDNEKMVAQAVTFFIAGFETTSATLSFSLYELAKHPEYQDRVREEAEAVFSEHEFIPYEVVNTEMVFTGMVMRETLRKYPPAPHLSRRSLNDYKIPGTNDIIEKGIPVYLPVYALQMDPEHHPDPERFDPERFNPEHPESVKPFTWLPFGGGPRNCLGERFATVSVKSAIANIIYNFKVELVDKSMDKIEFHPRAFTTAPNSLVLPLRFKKIYRDNTKYPFRFQNS